MLLQSDTYLYGDILTMCLQVRTLDDACVFFLASFAQGNLHSCGKGFFTPEALDEFLCVAFQPKSPAPR